MCYEGKILTNSIQHVSKSISGLIVEKEIS
jgi:hypothetical protein